MQKILKTVDINDIIPYENNPRHNDQAVKAVAESIKQCDYIAPIIVDEDMVILAGHTRHKALRLLGKETVEVMIVKDLTKEQKKKYRLLDNKTNELAEWDFDKLTLELDSLDFGGFDFGFDIEEEKESLEDIIEDDPPEPPEEPKSKLGDIYQLGNHRVMCGDSTDTNALDRLMNGAIADLVFTDPPYGMKKENEGVLNDNLNYDDLLDFNKQWIPLTFGALKDNGSWYCWGTDEPLMDIYSNILKPMIKENKITFRNLLTWDKGNGQGQLSEDFRMYPVADEKCLFVMCGRQETTNNYSEGFFEPYSNIRDYLRTEREKSGLSIKQLNEMFSEYTNKTGCRDRSVIEHYFTKGQWIFPTREIYENILQKTGYWQKDYEELRADYEEHRAYFDNVHDNQNNVWHFDRAGKDEREHAGGHATPKPIALCARAIKSSSRENELVLDVFGGSGSTLIAAEQLGRRCYMMELDPHYVDVIVERWENLTGKKAVLING